MKRKFGFKNQAYDEKLQSIPQNFAVLHDTEKKVTELNLFGDVGNYYWEDSFGSVEVANALKEANGNDIYMRINSPGGNAFEGVAIYNLLNEYKEQHGAKITAHIVGYACSAASLPPMAADEVIMGKGTMLMIHEASTIVWGNKRDFRSQADMLEELENGIIDIYMTKANVSRDEIREKVDAETWFSATKAIEVGFATSSASTVEGNSEEVENLKNQVTTLQNEIEQIKNQTDEKPAPTNVARKAFLNYLKTEVTN